MPAAASQTATKQDLDLADAVRRLRDAQDDHDSVRRAFRAGVTSALLAADHRRQEILGEAIAALARAVARQCSNSEFCDGRPDITMLTARLSESIDDPMDEPAWAVVDAAARLAAME